MGFYRSMPADISLLPPTTNGYFYSGKKIETKVDVTLIPFMINSYTPARYVEGLDVVFNSPSSINANCTNITSEGPNVYFDNTNVNRPQLIVSPNVRKIYLSSCDNLFNNCQNMTDWNCLDYLNLEHCTNFQRAFYACYHLNRQVIISNEAINCRAMFLWCQDFNQPVTIPFGVTDCAGMFTYCTNFNQPVTIPDSVTDCVDMFQSCRKLNQSVIIGNNVTNCVELFDQCYNFNQTITIPFSVTNCAFMFSKCNNLSENIYFKGNTYRTLNVSSLLNNRSNSKRVNVCFNSVFNSIFNVRTTSSIVGNTVTWTAMTNGFYNATYNVYCYYNYAG